MSGWGVIWAVCACACATPAETVRFPDDSATVRIDTKVRFVEHSAKNSEFQNANEALADEAGFEPFEPAMDTVGFYNQPPGAGRYPVRVEAANPYRNPYRVDKYAIFAVNHKTARKADQTSGERNSEEVPLCKCVANSECHSAPETSKACGPHKNLCCSKRPLWHYHRNSEIFNEAEDERLALQPGRSMATGPFPPPPNVVHTGYFSAPQDTSLLVDHGERKPILVGPGGPTGHIGPAPNPQLSLPVKNHPYDPSRDATQSESAQRGILVGPGGPTGAIGPIGRRPVLVGPGGYTGMVGPYNFPGANDGRGVLVGPGGPTGVIGPYGYAGQGHGMFTGAGTAGVVGRRRGILVGPGGPTGRIGPMEPFSRYGK